MYLRTHWVSLLLNTESQQDFKFSAASLTLHLEPLTLSLHCGKPISHPFFIYQPLGDLI